MTKSEVLIKTIDLSKDFKVGEYVTTVLRNVNLQIHKGEFVIIYGQSGSGKSTLLNSIIGLEPITRGELWFDNRRVDQMLPDELSVLRTRKIGAVYQQPTWIKSLSVLENISLPLLIDGASRQLALKKAHARLNEVGLIRYSNYKPTEISGGEQQRVGLARALINNPETLVLDEPTGNLDTATAAAMLKLLIHLNKKGITVIMVTHNLSYLPIADTTIRLTDGRVVYHGPPPKHTRIERLDSTTRSGSKI